MNSESQIYQNLRCSKCERRLNKPLELNCAHMVCRGCLESTLLRDHHANSHSSLLSLSLSAILHNHRTNARCPACEQPLGNYQIENYSYLSTKHVVMHLLTTLPDVNRCETCPEFTRLTTCAQCLKSHCKLCESTHAETHRARNEPAKSSLDDFTPEEQRILESIRDDLTENEYEQFVHTARVHLNQAIAKGNEPSVSDQTGDSPTSVNAAEASVYDWSRHPKLNADDVLRSKPERVKELLRLEFTPRPYQIRMVRAGLKRENSLVCLQTGAGKTFVSIHE